MGRVIYAWPVASSRRVTTYEVLLDDAGTLSCECPAFIFCKAGQPRTCRHVREKHAEAVEILRRFKAGLALPPKPTLAPAPRMPLKKAVGDGLVDAIAAVEL